MARKVTVTLTLVLLLAHGSWAGSWDDHHGYEHHHVTVGKSYQKFHGPVDGHPVEVHVPYVSGHGHEHNHIHGDHHQVHGHVTDYVAHPKYEYAYGVEDHHTGDYHEQKESRDGHSVHGAYMLKQPDGKYRVVSYQADKEGFHAQVKGAGDGYGLSDDGKAHVEFDVHHPQVHKHETHYHHYGNGGS